jgi:hypothetical protein
MKTSYNLKRKENVLFLLSTTVYCSRTSKQRTKCCLVLSCLHLKINECYGLLSFVVCFWAGKLFCWETRRDVPTHVNGIPYCHATVRWSNLLFATGSLALPHLSLDTVPDFKRLSPQRSKRRQDCLSLVDDDWQDATSRETAKIVLFFFLKDVGKNSRREQGALDATNSFHGAVLHTGTESHVCTWELANSIQRPVDRRRRGPA